MLTQVSYSSGNASKSGAGVIYSHFIPNLNTTPLCATQLQHNLLEYKVDIHYSKPVDAKEHILRADHLYQEINPLIEQASSSKELSCVTLEDFLIMQPILKDVGLSYIYISQDQKLTVMAISAIHENIAAEVHDGVGSTVARQVAANPELKYTFLLHRNRPTFYVSVLDRAKKKETYTSDFSLFVDDNALLHNEVVLAQRWDDLLFKVDRILKDENVWGVIVVRVREEQEWSSSSLRVRKSGTDYVPHAAWKQQIKLTQSQTPYGSLTVNGIRWIGDIRCDVYFFPSTWEMGVSTPTAYSLSPTGPIDFSGLDVQLNKMWLQLMRDVGARVGVSVKPINLSIDWEAVRIRLIEGIGSTAYDRYKIWYGPVEYMQREMKERRDWPIRPPRGIKRKAADADED